VISLHSRSVARAGSILAVVLLFWDRQYHVLPCKAICTLVQLPLRAHLCACFALRLMHPACGSCPRCAPIAAATPSELPRVGSPFPKEAPPLLLEACYYADVDLRGTVTPRKPVDCGLHVRFTLLLLHAGSAVTAHLRGGLAGMLVCNVCY
jgi:hypothetical protein